MVGMGEQLRFLKSSRRQEQKQQGGKTRDRQALIQKQQEAHRQALIQKQQEADRQAQIQKQQEADRQALIRKQQEADRQAPRSRRNGRPIGRP